MSKKYCCALLLLSFSSFATAAEPESYEKCASIKAASERVKCYDSLAKQATKKQTPGGAPLERKTEQAITTNKANQNPELRKDMQALIST